MPGGGLISAGVGSLLDGMMREIWTGTLALLRAVMGLVGELGSLDVTPGGGAISNELWTTMLQLAALIAVILFFAQLAAAAVNPRRHMFQAATGPVQYGVALALSVALVAALLGAADGLSAVILQQGANVTDTAAAMDQLGLVDDNNAVKATVLGLLGIIAVVPLAIGYGITLLFRSAGILVLVATLPVTAAGLTNLATKTWFWRVARWLLALIFLKPAFALCFSLGSGIVAAAGRTAGPGAVAGELAPADGSGAVTLLLGLGIMFVALFAPYAMFRLFAFIEPGTQPHQAMMSSFSSAAAGFKASAGGVATADVGSVLSGATGGRFAGGDGSGGSGAGLLAAGGSSGSGGDAKQQAAAAGLAAATGGASAAAAAGGAGASSGAVSAGAANGAAGAGAEGTSSGEEGSSEALAGAGAGAAAASGGGGGGGAMGSSGTSGSGGGWSVASKASGAAAAAAGAMGAAGGGRVGAAAQALGGAASGAASAGAAIGGATPMAPSPMGGTTGSVGDRGLGDYSGGHLAASLPRTPIPPRPAHSYRDESFEPGSQHQGDDGDSEDEGITGVIR